MRLQTERVRTLEQVRAFLGGSEAVDFAGVDRDGVYDLVRRTLVRLRYHRLGKGDKGLVKRYLGKVTGLSRAQLTRLIGQHRRTGRVEDRRGRAPAVPFLRRYTRLDVRLLAEVDEQLGQMSGAATRKVLRRQWQVFGDPRFERLSELSNGHLYNLRKSRTYRNARRVWTRTRPTAVSIGVRRRPDPRGRPGFVRVDTVHQGDLDGVKGVYHINVVDEVTQWQYVGTVQAISEAFLIPVLEALIEAFPFEVKGFHADNGSEYVNHNVAALLKKLHVGTFTKSRARHTNDNALAESKNASVIRKWFGYSHIPGALRRAGQRLQSGLALTVSELPPTVPVSHRGDRRHRPGAQALSRCRRDDAVREAEVDRGRRSVPRPRHHLQSAGRRRPRAQRPASRRSLEPRASGSVPVDQQRGLRRGLSGCPGVPAPSCGVVDESCGPARALRVVGTARGQPLRVDHRLPPLAGLSTTNSTGPTTNCIA